MELAQNAADAAARAGVPGRLRLRLDGSVLTAANTGAPLDGAGVEALSTLRASAKRPDPAAGPAADPVGRFGVGFAAVLAVTDEPGVVSRSGAVRWSLAQARALAAGLPGVATEVRRRSGAVPVLRLPLDWPDAPAPPDGFSTEVVLPLRDGAAHALAGRLLAETDPTLLLTLPGLADLEIEVEGVLRRIHAEPDGADVVVHDGGVATRWRTAAATGRLDPDLLAGRPVEERSRRTWSVTWAVPLGPDGRPAPLPAAVPPVVRAPTRTDEPLALPAVLVASFPLDPTRRHVAEGPLADAVAAAAGRTYAELLAALPAHPDVLALVPTGVAAGPVEARVRRAAAGVLPETPLLPVAGDPGARLRGRDAVALDLAHDGLVAVLADAVAGLLPAAWCRPGNRAALAALGVRRLGLAEVVDALGTLDRPPAWWRRLYAELADAVPAGPQRDALGALPVPLAGGRVVTGPRGLVLPGDGGLPAGLAALGVRVVHPDAAHPLLRSLGASGSDARDLLADHRVRAAVAESYDRPDPWPVAEAVLSLAAAAALRPGELPWLADLALPGDDGEWYPAGELLLADGELAVLVAPDAPFGRADPALVERFGVEVLTAVGVLDTFAVVREPDVPADGDLADHDLDGEDDWLDELAALAAPDPAVVAELVAVRDLDLVRAGAWPPALQVLARPPLRAAVVEPARLLVGGRTVDAPSYAAWWLAGHPVLGGRLPREWAVGDLGGLYEPAPTGLDPEFLRALGVVASVEAAVEHDPAGVVARLADPAREVTVAVVRRAHALLAAVDPERFDPPERVRALPPGAVTPAVVPAADAVVVDAPDLLAVVADRPAVPVPPDTAARLAYAFALPVASELGAYPVVGSGRPVDWAALPGAALAAARAGGLPATRLVLHERLEVTGPDGAAVAVRWRALPGADHVVAGDAAALGRALAWRCGRWPARAALAEALDERADPRQLALED